MTTTAATATSQDERPLVAVSATSAPWDGAVRVRLNASYLRALEGAGAVPVVVAPLADPSLAARALAGADGLVLTGGEDVDPARYDAPPHPRLGTTTAARDAWELALVAEARRRRLPVLAICRGVQLLNVALGGTLVQDLPSQRPDALSHDPGGDRARRVHGVDVAPGSRLAAALGTIALRVNSVHHQALDRVAEGLRATAHAPDGLVEGVETTEPDWWAVGVQWHPEDLVAAPEPWDRALLAAFARRAAERRMAHAIAAAGAVSS